MYPAPFDYHRPESLEEALALLARLGPEAKILAGGASLIPVLKYRLAEPAHLIDVTRIPGLDAVADGQAGLRIGALVRQNDLARSSAARHGAIADACRVIADPLVRNVGTIGGNVAHGDPANDHPAVLLALGADLRLRSATGERSVAATVFFVDVFQTAVGPDEILTAIELPAGIEGPDAGSAYVKFERQVGDYAIAAAAAYVRVRGGRIEEARVAFTNLAPTARRSPGIETALAGGEPTPAAIALAVDALAPGEIEPWDDLRASASAKWTMARAAARRAIERAAMRATGMEAGA